MDLVRDFPLAITIISGIILFITWHTTNVKINIKSRKRGEK